MMHLLATPQIETRDAFEFAGMPGGWARLLAFIIFVGLCYAVFWLYRREGRAGASLRMRLSLAAVRCVVLLLLALIWLEPVIATYLKRTIPAKTIVLVDDSASMAISDSPDVDARKSRLDAVRGLLTGDSAAWLKRLDARNELAVYSFSQQTHRAALPWTGDAAASAPTTGAASRPSIPLDAALTGRGTVSDLGQGLTLAVGDAADSPIAGIVILTDGNVNRGLSLEDAGRLAAGLRAPVYAVGIGAVDEPPNIRIAALTAPATVAKGDPLEIRVEVGASGMEAQPMRLELTARSVAAGAASAERVVGSADVTVGGDLPPAEARFRVSADVAGEFVYRARVPVLPIEAVDFDNSRAASVLVIDAKLRVLIVSGRPTYDYRAIVALLGRDKTVDLSCWLQSADASAVRDGTTIITELPRKPEVIFQYDAILLLDPDPREFDAAWAVTVRRLVDEFGGGVLLQAGPIFTSRFLRDERLADLNALLPVAPDPDAAVRISERGSFSTIAVPMRVPDDARAHPLMQLHSDPATNQAVWDALPGVWWFYPVLREKPLAAVLLRGTESGGATPLLLAAQPFGAGRSVFLGFDSTWRWRATAERYFDRFWVQGIRYLAQARRQGVSRRGTIVLDRDTYNVGDYARIEARVFDANFAPLHEPTVAAALEFSDGQSRPLSLAPIAGREGWFGGRALLEVDGPAVVRLPLAGGEGREELVKYFAIQRPEIELAVLKQQVDGLKGLAEATGGRYLPLADAGTLPEEIRNASIIRPLQGPRRSLWDSGWVLSLVAMLLGAEWFVRRRNHLL
ncbi:MAG: hypothetical protein AMXMBFR47_45960 [Planctomycetota bacterium]